MALSSRCLLLLLLLSTSFCLSKCSIFGEETIFFTQRERKLADNTCGPVNCMNGECSVSTTFPFYKCTCKEGWQSPFNTSWIPCVLPNCSLDLGCNNGSNTSSTPPPAVSTTTPSFSLCSLPICGNGDCDLSNNSSLLYECNCNSGSTNLFNASNGYCVQPCSVGAGCSGLNFTLGNSPPSPPSSPSPSNAAGQNSSQGTSKRYVSTLIMGAILLLQMGWRF